MTLPILLKVGRFRKYLEFCMTGTEMMNVMLSRSSDVFVVIKIRIATVRGVAGAHNC